MLTKERNWMGCRTETQTNSNGSNIRATKSLSCEVVKALKGKGL